MELDDIIRSLNEKNYASRPAAALLTEEEEALVRAFSPGKNFIVYGTLAPGRPNHHVVARIDGVWREGVVKGRLVDAGWGASLGYRAFRHAAAAEQEEIEAHILFSEELAANWAMLDEFEGGEYGRVLAKFELVGGEVGVGNIYAIKK